MASFDAKEFITNPSSELENLVYARKSDFISIARSLGIALRTNMRKHEICDKILQFYMNTGELGDEAKEYLSEENPSEALTVEQRLAFERLAVEREKAQAEKEKAQVEEEKAQLALKQEMQKAQMEKERAQLDREMERERIQLEREKAQIYAQQEREKGQLAIQQQRELFEQEKVKLELETQASIRDRKSKDI